MKEIALFFFSQLLLQWFRVFVTKVTGILEQITNESESVEILSDTKLEESMESKVQDVSEPKVPVNVHCE